MSKHKLFLDRHAPLVEFSKREIMAWLKLVGDDTRPSLNGVAFVKGKLVFTNGYVLVELNTKSDYTNAIVRESVLREWAKSHKPDDTITIDELYEMATSYDDMLGGFPEYERLFPSEHDDWHIWLNSGLMCQALDVLGGDVRVEISKRSDGLGVVKMLSSKGVALLCGLSIKDKLEEL